MKKLSIVALVMTGLVCLFAAIISRSGAALPSDPTEVPATPSPTPVLSVKDQITYAVQNTGQGLYGTLKSIVYVDEGAIITYYIPADQISDHENARNQIKINSFYVEKSIWQKVKQVKEVQVTVQGDLVDKYGNSSVGDIGQVDLNQGTEEKFNWDGLDFNSAWNVYDTAWLLPDLLT